MVAEMDKAIILASSCEFKILDPLANSCKFVFASYGLQIIEAILSILFESVSKVSFFMVFS